MPPLEVLSFRHVLHGLCLRGALDVTTLDGHGHGRSATTGDAAWSSHKSGGSLLDGKNLMILEVMWV